MERAEKRGGALRISSIAPVRRWWWEFIGLFVTWWMEVRWDSE